MNAGDEERLRAVDVTDAGQHLLVEQQCPDRLRTFLHTSQKGVGLGTGLQRVRAEAGNDRVAIIGTSNAAVGRAGKIDRAAVRRHSHADLALYHRHLLAGRDAILAEETEVHVAYEAIRPPVEEVLTVRLDAIKHDAVHESSVALEAALWRGHSHWPTSQDR